VYLPLTIIDILKKNYNTEEERERERERESESESESMHIKSNDQSYYF
jgi:hypothetical protein